MDKSVAIIKNCLRGYRIPEVTRQGHNLVNKIRIEAGDNNLQTNMFD
jgi:deoxyribonuclease V